MRNIECTRFHIYIYLYIDIYVERGGDVDVDVSARPNPRGIQTASGRTATALGPAVLPFPSLLGTLQGACSSED